MRWWLGISEEGTPEQRSGGDEGMSYVNIWERVYKVEKQVLKCYEFGLFKRDQED